MSTLARHSLACTFPTKQIGYLHKKFEMSNSGQKQTYVHSLEYYIQGERDGQLMSTLYSESMILSAVEPHAMIGGYSVNKNEDFIREISFTATGNSLHAEIDEAGSKHIVEKDNPHYSLRKLFDTELWIETDPLAGSVISSYSFDFDELSLSLSSNKLISKTQRNFQEYTKMRI
jgi:hypothetical protein